MTIPTPLIENALVLTGKTMEDVIIYDYNEYENKEYKIFSIEKFSYYLLSPEFIGKYKNTIEDAWYDTTIFLIFGEAIYEFQKGNPEPLISLLEKIPGTPTTTHH